VFAAAELLISIYSYFDSEQQPGRHINVGRTPSDVGDSLSKKAGIEHVIRFL
jgi:hypothetical protein